jgi:hypothetical protein
VADGWCWFVLREKYCWLIAGGWFVLREKYCWLVADKPNEQAALFFGNISGANYKFAQLHGEVSLHQICPYVPFSSHVRSNTSFPASKDTL